MMQMGNGLPHATPYELQTRSAHENLSNRDNNAAKLFISRPQSHLPVNTEMLCARRMLLWDHETRQKGGIFLFFSFCEKVSQ